MPYLLSMRNDSQTPNQPGHGPDDLFTPSLQSEQPSENREKPWRQYSQMLVAFFGGVLPYTFIAYVNGQRLGLQRDQQRLILVLGSAGVIGVICLGYLIGVKELPNCTSSQKRILRYGGKVIALLVYFAVSQIQKSADRIYRFRVGRDDYASLLLPGIATVLLLGFLQAVIVVGVLKLMSWL